MNGWKIVKGVTKGLIKGAWEVGVTAIEAGFWTGSLTGGLVVKTADACRARKSIHQGVLLCPQGHPIPTEPGPFECQACGFIYRGSIWRCNNHECGAVTPYVDCPTCGESVRNPWRWGRQ